MYATEIKCFENTYAIDHFKYAQCEVTMAEKSLMTKMDVFLSVFNSVEGENAIWMQGFLPVFKKMKMKVFKNAFV